jgi:hypothetical protein
MPLVRYAFGALAASLIASAAIAQDTSTPAKSTDNNPPPADSAASAATGAADTATAAATSAPAAAAAASAATPTSAVVNGQTVEVVASQTVPDTKANRAKFGQPLSREGRATAAKGN